MGAVINLRQAPPNAKVEAIVGMGGPLAGTIAALIWYYVASKIDSPLLTEADKIQVAYLGFVLNLFNLLPVPPLDGGRITAAISPWIWMLGIVGLFGLLIHELLVYHQLSWILLLVLMFAMPRIVNTLRARRQLSAYYNISRASSFAIALLYVTLGLVLLVMYVITGNQLMQLRL
jgi:Zn-dependent protease